MKQRRWKRHNDKGELILESLIVYPVTMCMLCFVLAIFSVLFQRWNLQTVANDTAARMAQTYRLFDADEVTGYLDIGDWVDVSINRCGVKSMFENEEKDAMDQRVKDYASWRLQKTTFTKNVTPPEISGIVHEDALGRRHLEVVIRGEYTVPLGELLSFFGLDSTISYEAKAYADCVDLIDYINTVDYVNEQTNVSGKFVELIDSVLSLLDNLFNS